MNEVNEIMFEIRSLANKEERKQSVKDYINNYNPRGGGMVWLMLFAIVAALAAGAWFANWIF